MTWHFLRTVTRQYMLPDKTRHYMLPDKTRQDTGWDLEYLKHSSIRQLLQQRGHNLMMWKAGDITFKISLYQWVHIMMPLNKTGERIFWCDHQLIQH